MAHLFPVACLFVEERKEREKVVSPLLPEYLEQVGSPAQAARTADVRLIGEDAENRFPEFLFDRFLVSFHRDIDEFLSDAGHKQVDVGVTAIPVRFSQIGLFVEIIFPFCFFVCTQRLCDVGPFVPFLFQDDEILVRFVGQQVRFRQGESLPLVV